MNVITQLLSKSLKNRNPQFDLWGSDRRVLSIACQDLMNYLKFHWDLNKQEIEFKLEDKVSSYFYENPREFEEFVHLWTGIWMKKWNERVKVILRKEKRRNKRTRKKLRNNEVILSRKKRKEIKDLVMEALIRNGEICGTSILAEDILKIEIGSYIKRKVFNEEPEKLLNVVNKVLKRARKVSQSKGPLIFIRLDRRWFRLLHEDAR